MLGDMSFYYGYDSDYAGSGPYIMYYDATVYSFVSWTPATLSGDNLTYE